MMKKERIGNNSMWANNILLMKIYTVSFVVSDALRFGVSDALQKADKFQGKKFILMHKTHQIFMYKTHVILT